jgi:N6-L-threonylcarbamoyladenine synthase
MPPGSATPDGALRAAGGRTHALVLGIETSCDETAAAVLAEGTRLLASVVRGQAELHGPYGGVVPELASRDHLGALDAVVSAALGEAQISLGDLTGVAVTAGPGLLGSLLVGVCFAKALAYRAGVPCVGVHHLAGHLAAAELADAALRPPYLGLVVSGGHTALYRIVEGAPAALLGATLDDAVGEAFDKVAKLLGLPFPGGPALARLAEAGDERAVALPRPLAELAGLDFSYSGLKTAVAVELGKRGGAEALDARARADLAASFQAAATDPLVRRARRAARAEGLSRIAVVGGVAANRRLRREMERAGAADGFTVHFPPAELCTDNAAMVAAAGASLLARGERHGLDLTAFSRVPTAEEPWVRPADAVPSAPGPA